MNRNPRARNARAGINPFLNGLRSGASAVMATPDGRWAVVQASLTALVAGREVWLDGGHNPDAGAAIARHFEGPVHLVIGMLASKNPLAIVEPLGERIASLSAVPVSGSDCHDAGAFGPQAKAFGSVEEALKEIKHERGLDQGRSR